MRLSPRNLLVPAITSLVLLLPTAGLASTPQPTATSSSQPAYTVVVDDSGIPGGRDGVLDQPWSSKSLSAARKAEGNQAAEIQAEVDRLAKKHAVTFERIFVTTRPPGFRKWHDFIPSFRQWYLVGHDKIGAKVGKSKLLPQDLPNWANRLVTFGPNGCSISRAAKFPCKIHKAKPEQYLNAALRVWIDFNGPVGYSAEVSAYYANYLRECVNSSGPFTLTKDSLLCEPNADDPYMPLEWPTSFSNEDLDFSFTISINEARRVLTMKLKPGKSPRINERGFVEPHSTVINFSK